MIFLASLNIILTYQNPLAQSSVPPLRFVEVDGTFNGQNIYIYNPIDEEKGYSIYQITVNNELLNVPTSSAMEIDLSKFKQGSYINISVSFDARLEKPTILNDEVLITESTFKLVDSRVSNNTIEFTTRNETTNEPFIIEKFNNGRWKQIEKVMSNGPGKVNEYVIEVDHFSGRNMYRLAQKDSRYDMIYARLQDYLSSKQPVRFYPKKVHNEMFLTEKAEYQIFDSGGKLLLKGEDKIIKTDKLEKGIYYISIDNTIDKFYKSTP